MERGDREVAHAALERARETIAPGTPDEEEAAYVALGFAVADLDGDAVVRESAALASLRPAGDAFASARVRRILDGAPPGLPDEARARLLALADGGCPVEATGRASGAQHATADAPVPVAPGPSFTAPADAWALRWEEEGEPPPDECAPGWTAAADEVDAETPRTGSESRPGEPPRPAAPADESGLLDPDLLRDFLLEQLLDRDPERDPELLFAVASTFLRNRQPAAAELLFSAAMQSAEMALAACEGLTETLVRAGRMGEAEATATRAIRLFAREGDRLLGLLHWRRVAARAQGRAEP
jgi:hypothetical protein